MVANKPRIVIVGAGIAGLSAAQQLCRAGQGDKFDVVVVEAAPRAGGRVFTSEFVGHRVEMGATWVQGITGSPVYALAHDAGALTEDAGGHLPYERMDGPFPDDRVLTVAEGGDVVDADKVAKPVEELYRGMMDAARAGEAGGGGGGVEEYLRRGLRAYQAARTDGSGSKVKEVEEALLAMHINRERTDTSADALGDLDLAAEGEYRDFPGDHVTIPGGYTRVVEHLVAALPPGTVRLGLRLRRLDWGETPVRLHFADDGAAALIADHVILTVSLGVLKASLGKDAASAAGAIAFDPPLPQFKRDAVSRLGFGVVNKLFVELEAVEPEGGGEEQQLAGAAAPPDFPFLHMAFDGHVAKIPWWMRGTESICPVHAGSSVALAWFAGREAKHLEFLPDDDVVRGVQATLDSFLPATSSSGATSRWRVKRIERSRWAGDPLFVGSYSYVAVGSSGEDLDRMAEPLPRGGVPEADRTPPPLRVLFAGEATHRTHYSTTHAAYLSGVREADRLLQHYP